MERDGIEMGVCRVMKPNKNKVFEDWFDSYFCDQQGEDSPYRYEDVKQAFNEGWRKGKVGKK